MHNFGANVKITRALGMTSASATSTLETLILDMASYDGVCFVTATPSTHADNNIHLVMSTANSTTTLEDCTGTAVPGTSTSLWLDIYQPKQRFVAARVIRAGAASKVGDVWAFQYRARSLPVSNTSGSVIQGEIHQSPDTGSAT